MPDTPARLVGPVALPSAGATLYTVPANTQAIVRSIHLANSHTSSIYNATLGINGFTAGYHLFAAYPIPASGSLDWTGMIVLNAGDTLQGLTTAVNVVTVVISGILVT